MGYLANLKKALSAETFALLEAELGDSFDDDYVPRKRLNDVIAKRNELMATIDTLEQSSKTNEGMLTKAEVDALLATKEAEHQSAIAQRDKDATILGKLANAHDAKLVLGLLDKDKLTDEASIDAEIARVATEQAFLFKKDSSDVPEGTGKKSTPEQVAQEAQLDAELDRAFSNFGMGKITTEE